MDDATEQPRRLVAFYRDYLGRVVGALPVCAGKNLPQTTNAQLDHVRWMLDQIDPMLDEHDRLSSHAVIGNVYGEVERLVAVARLSAKIQRWIGFIQGVFWANGIFTIDELRDHTRTEKKEQT